MLSKSNNEHIILKDQFACLRILWSLKGGFPPREGIRYLSVGLEKTVNKLQSVFERVIQGIPQILWILGDYGEGKSHLLRMITSLAKENKLAWAYVVHDKDQNVGLHKPASLFRRILWELQWEFPEMDLYKFESLMIKPPRYDRWWRQDLTRKLKDLSFFLREQKWQGLVICVDEFENFGLLHWNQLNPAFETLMNLLQSLEGPVLLCFALTNNGRETLLQRWRSKFPKVEKLLQISDDRKISLPEWSEELSLPLAEKIYTLHSVAFNWQPSISPNDIAKIASERAKNFTGSKWRVFLQTAVQVLEIEHQRTFYYQSRQQSDTQYVKPVISLNTNLQISKHSDKIQEGDRVEIVKTSLRGFRGIVEKVIGDLAKVILEGRLSKSVKLPLHALKKIRG